MPFTRPTLAELVDRIQNDLTTRFALTGTALRRSVVNVLARVEAAATHLLHGHLEFLSQQLFPDTSIGGISRAPGRALRDQPDRGGVRDRDGDGHRL
jgi:hypothetical protein